MFKLLCLIFMLIASCLTKNYEAKQYQKRDVSSTGDSTVSVGGLNTTQTEKSTNTTSNPSQSIFEQSLASDLNNSTSSNNTANDSAEKFLDNLKKAETKEMDVKSTTTNDTEKTKPSKDETKEETKESKPAKEETRAPTEKPKVTSESEKEKPQVTSEPEKEKPKSDDTGCSKECSAKNCLPHCSIECCLKKEEKQRLKVDQTSGIIVSDGKSGFADVTNTNFNKIYQDSMAGFSGKINSAEESTKKQHETTDLYTQQLNSNPAQFYPADDNFNYYNNFYYYPYQQRSVLARPYEGYNYNSNNFMYNNPQTMMPFYSTSPLSTNLPYSAYKRNRIAYPSTSGFGNRAGASPLNRRRTTNSASRVYSPHKNSFLHSSMRPHHGKPFVLRADNNLFQKYYDMFRTQSSSPRQY